MLYFMLHAEVMQCSFSVEELT